jgi:PAS domain S-box-containing protein
MNKLAPNKTLAVSELYRLAIEQTRDYALFLLDSAGRVMTWNAGAERIKGYSSDEIIGRHFSTFYTHESIASGWPAHELRAATAEGSFEDEGWRVRKDGSRFWASVVITALRGEDGKLLGFSKITRDLSVRKEQEEALRQSEERFRLLVEGVNDYSVYMLDPEGMVISWNVGAQRISGYSREEIVGKHFSRFYLPEDADTGKPWEELAKARQVGRAEDEGWRVKKNGDRYWARVIVNALHDGAGRLRGFAKITQDLTERRHLAKLDRATRDLNEFLAVLAHELRNPLAPIRTAVQVMATAPAADQVQEKMRQTIDRQSAQLQRIVDDMLDVARMTRGKLEIHRESVDLADVVRRAGETSSPAIAAKRHRFSVELPDNSLLVRGDIDRLSQLVANLLNNAARYTPPGGNIAIEVKSEAGDAIVKVSDSGRGIAPEDLERIFDLFAQGRSVTRQVGEGLGIGLALARSIAEMHGGTLTAHSEGEDKGSAFTLRIPLLIPAELVVNEPPPSVARSEGLSPKRILIVDDNVDAAVALRLLLASLGHEAAVAHSGVDALRLAIEFRPEVVLLDIGMPGLDGYEVAGRLRDLRLGAPLQIIAVTGWGQPADREKSREAGFDLHLLKPVDEAELARILSGRGGTLH